MTGIYNMFVLLKTLILIITYVIFLLRLTPELRDDVWRTKLKAFLIRLKQENTMAYKISDQCVNCGACESECPNEAISENGNARVIDAEKCISCGACASACPTEAISEE